MIKYILKFFGSIVTGLIVAIFVGIVGLSALVSYVTNTLNYVLQCLKSPMILWVSIASVLAASIGIYLIMTKYHSYKKLQSKGIIDISPALEKAQEALKNIGTGKNKIP